MSLNDPNWGRGGGSRGPGGGNQGPPDLDELWRNFNRRLSDLFGRKRPGSEPPRVSAGGPRLGGAGLIAGVVLAVWLASGFYIVVEGQRGIVLTFGKFAEETGSGLRWRLPWPIQSHEIVNIARSRALEIGYRNNNVKTRVDKEALMLTDDENIVSVQFAVQYVVKPNEAQDYLFTNKRPDETAQHAAETAMREVIGRSKMDAILYESRAEINLKAKSLMQQILDRYRTGILVQTVTIQSAQPPQDVQAAFSDQQSASQDREKQKNEGEAYANDVIPKAKGTASRLTQEAEGYKQRVIASAEGDASRFKQVLAEYAKAPAVTRERIYIETIQQILQTTSKVMLDYKGSGNLLYLPLDKLMQQAGAGSVDAGRPPQPDVAPSTEPGSRSRDRDLMRERGRGERP
ncbi:MAG TPA: FtsH protease activity modulator HflK [Burkholderiales bacterium]|nr:FtsH protease activity modulator HflK [Burkholderiales bacterium]